MSTTSTQDGIELMRRPPTPVGAGQSRRRRRAHRLAPYAFVAPALIAIALLTYGPLVKSALLSVTDTSLLRPNGSSVGLENFKDLLGSSQFWRIALQTLAWTVLSVGGSVVLGVAAALLLRRPTRGFGLLRAAMMLPWIAPPVVSAFVWTYLYRDTGPISPLVDAAGLSNGRVDFLTNVDTALLTLKEPLWAVIQVGVWSGMPFVFLFTLSALSSIPREIDEAAALDGATGWRHFRHITLPLIAPVLETTALLLALVRFGGFDLPFLLTQGGPDDASNVLGVYIYNTAFQAFEIGRGAAIGLILFALALPLSIVYVRRARREVARRGDRG